MAPKRKTRISAEEAIEDILRFVADEDNSDDDDESDVYIDVGPLYGEQGKKPNHLSTMNLLHLFQSYLCKIYVLSYI